MIKTGLKSLLISAFVASLVVAQTPTQQRPNVSAKDIARTNLVERVDAPTDSDMYCSGFVSSTAVTAISKIAGGWETPSQARFANGDYIYLTGGGYEMGAQYAVLRKVRDINDYEPYPGQKRQLRATGQVYAELGRVKIVKVDHSVGIAKVEFACDDLTVGDFTVPWQEKAKPAFRRVVPFDQFASPNGMTVGRIVGAKESMLITGSKDKVYLNIGADKGVKVGDYYRATRTYQSLRNDSVDTLLFKTTGDRDQSTKDQQMFPPRRVNEFPRKAIGEMIILTVTPSTSTAMITRSLEQVQVGDGVEMMEELPPLPPPPPEVMNPPQISCSASPATVRAGESSTVRCQASSPDQRPVTIAFSTDRGNLVPREDSAVLETANVAPGNAMVMATATDDRNQSANAVTQVNITAAPPPAAASGAGNLAFKPSSAYVDNRAKAMLDDVALRLQREAGSQVVLVGHIAPKEGTRLAAARAGNAKNYLTRDKGIDASRIQTRDGGAGGRTVQVWFVPAGAPMP